MKRTLIAISVACVGTLVAMADEGVANVKKRADVAMYQNKALNRYGA